MIKDKVPVSKALNRLVDTIKWYVDDDYDISTIVWKDEDVVCPTNDVIEAMRQTIANELSLVEHIDKRANEYPDLADFADAYYWAQQGDNTKMNEYIQKITEIKEKYPKVNNAS